MAIDRQCLCLSSQMETFVSDSQRRQCQKFTPDRQVPSGVLNQTLMLIEMFSYNFRKKKKARMSKF